MYGIPPIYPNYMFALDEARLHIDLALRMMQDTPCAKPNEIKEVTKMYNDLNKFIEEKENER